MQPANRETLPDGRTAEAYSLRDARGMAARIGTYGARLLSLRVPQRAGEAREVLLGHATQRDYVTGKGYLGACIGRYANRLAGGCFTLDGRVYSVPVNDPPQQPRNALHGGPRGFDQAIWQVEAARDDALALRHVSPDGDQGFPGRLEVRLRYVLSGDGGLGLDYEARCDQPTILNLTNHAYFNLAGAGDILDHVLEIAADRFTPVDVTMIPTGELRPVAGTPLDFRQPKRVGTGIGAAEEQLRIAGGYDHNFVLREAAGRDGLRLAARLAEPASGLAMEIWTSQPGLQFYSGNSLDGTQRGRDGRPLARRSGLCLETQHFPDSPNHPGFPSVVLRPGEVFRSRSLYCFHIPA